MKMSCQVLKNDNETEVVPYFFINSVNDVESLIKHWNFISRWSVDSKILKKKCHGGTQKNIKSYTLDPNMHTLLKQEGIKSNTYSSFHSGF